MAKSNVRTYTEKEMAVIGALAKANGKVTIADLSEILGDKVAAGTLTSIIKKSKQVYEDEEGSAPAVPLMSEKVTNTCPECGHKSTATLYYVDGEIPASLLK